MLTRNESIKVFLLWIPFAVILSIFFLFTYITNQHILRMAANDPQIQLAEDVGGKIASGLPIATLVLPQKIDIAHSLATFTIVYSTSGQVLFSNAVLNNQTPILPSGVFADAQKRQLRFTWQPAPGVRNAVVVTRFTGESSGFVLVGRSLREVEIREDELLQEVEIGWIVSIVILFITILGVVKIFEFKSAKK